MIRSGFVLLALAFTAMQSAGCATLLQGSDQSLAIVPYPGASTIKVTDSSGEVAYEGKAPANVKLKRGKTYTVVASKDGYQSETFKIEGSFKMGWMVADLFTSGPIGIGVDIVTGAPNTFDETGDGEVEVTLFRPGQKPKQIED